MDILMIVLVGFVLLMGLVFLVNFLDFAVPGFGCLVRLLPLGAIVVGVTALIEGNWDVVPAAVIVFLIGMVLSWALGDGSEQSSGGSGGDTAYDSVVPVDSLDLSDPRDYPGYHDGGAYEYYEYDEVEEQGYWDYRGYEDRWDERDT